MKPPLIKVSLYVTSHFHEKERKDKKIDDKIIIFSNVSGYMARNLIIFSNFILYKSKIEEYIYSHKLFIKISKNNLISLSPMIWSGGTNFVHCHLG
ncbi:hypothetical protein CG474_003745 [Bacillus cytotoxicus]|nr:hypothetical protein CG474_003745 [Bacillus cytotoxicus]